MAQSWINGMSPFFIVSGVDHAVASRMAFVKVRGMDLLPSPSRDHDGLRGFEVTGLEACAFFFGIPR